MFNVPLRTYHFFTGKIGGRAVPVLASGHQFSMTNYDKTVLNISAVSRVINSEVILLFPLRMCFYLVLDYVP